MMLAPMAFLPQSQDKLFKSGMCSVSLPFLNSISPFLSFNSLTNFCTLLCGFPACVFQRHVSLIPPPSHVIVVSNQTHVFTCGPVFFSPVGWKLAPERFLYVTHFILCPDSLHVARKQKLLSRHFFLQVNVFLTWFFGIKRHWI